MDRHPPIRLLSGCPPPSTHPATPPPHPCLWHPVCLFFFIGFSISYIFFWDLKIECCSRCLSPRQLRCAASSKQQAASSGIYSQNTAVQQHSSEQVSLNLGTMSRSKKLGSIYANNRKRRIASDDESEDDDYTHDNTTDYTEDVKRNHHRDHAGNAHKTVDPVARCEGEFYPLLNSIELTTAMFIC